MIVVSILALICMPVVALAAGAAPAVEQSAPLAADSLVKGFELSNIGAWFSFIFMIWTAISILRKQWRDEVATGKKSRWEFIMGAVPYVHGQAQKAKKLFKNENSAVKFIEYMDAVLGSAGHDPVQPGEKEAIKALGSGYHQEFKMLRDAGESDPLILNVSQKPLNDSGAEAGSSAQQQQSE